MNFKNIQLPLLSPKTDVVFHALFRKANNSILEAMLSSILGRKIKIKEFLDRHLSITIANEKIGVMDLRVEFEDGTNCNIEIQLKQYSYGNERFLYYLSDTYSSQLEKGNKYDNIHHTISIVITDYELDILKGLEDLRVKWQMRDSKTGKRLLTDKFELVIIELPKAKRIYEKKKDDEICQWMMFLDNPNNEEVVKIMETNSDIRKATEKLKQVSGDYELRRIAELREKAIRDEQAALDFATAQGIEQGIESGIEHEKINIAKKMLALNMPLETIIELTDLTKEQILKLK